MAQFTSKWAVARFEGSLFGNLRIIEAPSAIADDPEVIIRALHEGDTVEILSREDLNGGNLRAYKIRTKSFNTWFTLTYRASRVIDLDMEGEES